MTLYDIWHDCDDTDTFDVLMQADQLTSDIAAERTHSQKVDAERSMLDRQNKELQAKLSELEAQLKTRTKAAMQALESKIANLEEQLDAEARLVQLMYCESFSINKFAKCWSIFKILLFSKYKKIRNIRFVGNFIQNKSCVLL